MKWVVIHQPQYGYDGPGHDTHVVGIYNEEVVALQGAFDHAARIDRISDDITTVEFTRESYTIHRVEDAS